MDASLISCCSLVPKSCPTLSDPMDYSLPGSSVHGIFQARVLEWGAIAFSGESTKRGYKTLWDVRLLRPWKSPKPLFIHKENHPAFIQIPPSRSLNWMFPDPHLVFIYSSAFETSLRFCQSESA